MNCVKCGAIVKEGSNYCPGCGKGVYSGIDIQGYNVKEVEAGFCKNCGTKSLGGRYCGGCGTQLRQEHLAKKGGIGFLTNYGRNVSLNEKINKIKEKCTEGKKVDIKLTAKHGLVFSVCMLAFTLLFILIAQKVCNMLPPFEEEFWLKNSGLRNVKNYLLAALYGLRVYHRGNIAVIISAGVKITPILIWLTLLFVTFSFLVTKKVTQRNEKYNMLELMMFALVNSAAVTLCGIFFETIAGIKKSETADYYENIKLSLTTGISFINCLLMAFLVTLCLLVIVNGIKCKKEERNSTFLYAFRSNLIFIGAVLLLVVFIWGASAIKNGLDVYGIIGTGITSISLLFQGLYAAAGSLCFTMFVKIGGSDVCRVFADVANTDIKVVDLTYTSVSSIWLTAAIGVLMLFLFVRVVLDTIRILKSTNTENTQETVIELCKYAGGFALLVAFCTYLFAAYFRASLNIPSYISELANFKAVNGKSMEVYLGAGNVIGVFFKTFLCIFVVSLITLWLVKQNKHIMDTYILAKKKIITIATFVIVCLPAVCILTISNDKMNETLYSYEHMMQNTDISELELEEALEKKGLNEEFFEEWDSVYRLMKSLIE